MNGSKTQIQFSPQQRRTRVSLPATMQEDQQQQQRSYKRQVTQNTDEAEDAYES